APTRVLVLTSYGINDTSTTRSGPERPPPAAPSASTLVDPPQGLSRELRQQTPRPTAGSSVCLALAVVRREGVRVDFQPPPPLSKQRPRMRRAHALNRCSQGLRRATRSKS